MPAQHVPIGAPVHEREARAIAFIVQKLPDDYIVYSNVELTRRSGASQTYEHDAIVIAPHAVFTVEIKSWGGRISGNRDLWTLHDGTQVNAPIPLTSSKARALKGQIVALGADLGLLWVQPLIYLSAPDASPRITEGFRALVTTRDDVISALTDPAWLSERRLHHLKGGQRKRIATLLGDGRPPQPPARVGKYALVEQIPSEDRPFDVWIGQDEVSERRILHIYDLDAPTQTARERLKARALREASLHQQLYGAPDIQRYYDYLIDPAPSLRLALAFEDTTGLIPLDTWLGEHTPPREQRLRIAERLSRALAWVHGRGLVHRDISPEAFRVSPEAAPRTLRLCAFELARDRTNLTATMTPTGSSLSQSRAIAPELIRRGEAGAPADLFSLGALLYHLFVGRPLFKDVDDVLRHTALDPAPLLEAGLPGTLAQLLTDLLAPRPEARPEGGAQAVADALQALRQAPPRRPSGPTLAPGEILRRTYELVRPLGRGATGEIWQATHVHLNTPVALKIAKHAHIPILQREATALKVAKHPNLVSLVTLEPLDEGNMLVLDLAEGVTGAEWAELGDGLDPEQLLRLAEGLFGALDALHGAGWLHRDVKPGNLLLTEPDARPTLLDLGLAAPVDTEGDLAVGSVAYKDPLLFTEGRWTPANDLFAAWLTLFEVLTGLHPFGGGAPDPDNEAEIGEDLFPESIPPEDRGALAEVFRSALSLDRARRPDSPPRALAALNAALGALRSEAPDPQDIPPDGPPAPGPVAASAPALLPADADPSTAVATLPLSGRALAALDRLGVTFVADLIPLDLKGIRRLRNVGAKTAGELRRVALEARARFPGAPPPAEAQAPAEEPLPFYPPLVGDERRLDALGTVVTPRLRILLGARGVTTVGDLAAYPARAVPRIRGVGPQKVERIREAMDRLTGAEARTYAHLEELAAALAEETSDAVFAVLSRAVGLEDGVPFTTAQLQAHFDVSRQRIHQTLTLGALRADASAGRWLADAVRSALPALGFAGLPEVARVLEPRLPSTTGLSHVGFARLGAWLLTEEARVVGRRSVEIVTALPWDAEAVGALAEGVVALLRDAEAEGQPPPRAAEVEAHLWGSISPSVRAHLDAQGLKGPDLLAALRRLRPEVERNGLGQLYIQPVPWPRALAWLRPHLKDPTTTWEALKVQARQAYGQLDLPPRMGPEVVQALTEGGYRLEGREGSEGRRIVDGERVEEARPTQSVDLDPTIPRQRFTPTPEAQEDAGAAEVSIPPALRGLVASARQGGFRVVMLPPGEHHRLSEALAQRLGQILGAETVTYVDVDALLMDILRREGLWEDALFIDRRPSPAWGWAHAELEAGLDAAMARHGARGRVVVLGQPSLMGPLDLMTWLTGFYDRARGGAFGLVILAAPGGLRDERVRLNGQYHLPYTPDMAAVYLEEA